MGTKWRKLVPEQFQDDLCPLPKREDYIAAGKGVPNYLKNPQERGAAKTRSATNEKAEGSLKGKKTDNSKDPKETKLKNKCGICGERGHNRKNCPHLDKSNNDVVESKPTTTSI